jgi:hypothetical protein
VTGREITHEEFVKGLIEVMRSMTSEQLLAIPGVWEALSEALNNEVITHIEAWRKVYERRGRLPGV